jgi:conjugal transfer pilus assembly protein TraI
MSTPTHPRHFDSNVERRFEIVPVDVLLESQGNLIDRIRLAFGIDRQTFDADVLKLIGRYADYVLTLPASPDSYFSGPNGLFRLGLEVALFSLQGADAHIFSGRATISTRRELEPKWRLATFIGGLCCGLDRPLAHLAVVASDGRPWPAFVCPLGQWTSSAEGPFYLRWNEQVNETPGIATYALQYVVPSRIMERLGDGNTVVLPNMIASVGGLTRFGHHNALEKLNRRAFATVVAHNLHAQTRRDKAARFSSHLERFVIDALRSLAATSPIWAPNRDKSRVWYGPDGLFLVWPQAATDIVACFDNDQLPGLPRSADVLLEILIGAGAINLKRDGDPHRSVQPPTTQVTVQAIKLSSLAVLYTSPREHPTPLPCPLEAQEQPIKPPSPAANGTAQLDLGLDARPEVAPVNLHGPEQQPPPPESPSVPEPVWERGLELDLPLKLGAVMRQALLEIVAESGVVRGDGPWAQDGLFVPFSAFLERGVEALIVLRDLDAARMLAPAEHGGLRRSFTGSDGIETTGIVLKRQCFTGVAPDASTFAGVSA